MIHNRFHKSTLGLGAEVVIAKAVSALEAGVAGTASGGTPAFIAVPITIAADPTPADSITITVDGVPYLHTVPGGDETTAQAHDAILALLSANAQGFEVAAHSGTTSSSYTLVWPGGTTGNGKVVSLVETGSTFTVAGPYTFAGGVNADAVGSDTIADFITNEIGGAIWAYWDDTNLALSAGDTLNPANIDRKFFYAWKQADGVYHRTTAIPVRGRKYTSAAYNAGTALVKTLTMGGTYSATQYLTVRIINKSQGTVPYPSYDYTVTIGSGGINQANIDIAAKINAETFDPIVVATTGTNVLTLTANSKLVSFDIVTYIETTPSQLVDATVPVVATTVAQVQPIGDFAFMKILDQYAQENLGNPLYNTGMYTQDEFGVWSSNVLSTINYGILVVTNDRTELGEVRNYSKRNYAVIAVVTGDEAKLAAL